jgi:hypothetical protein
MCGAASKPAGFLWQSFLGHTSQERCPVSKLAACRSIQKAAYRHLPNRATFSAYRDLPNRATFSKEQSS